MPCRTQTTRARSSDCRRQRQRRPRSGLGRRSADRHYLSRVAPKPRRRRRFRVGHTARAGAGRGLGVAGRRRRPPTGSRCAFGVCWHAPRSTGLPRCRRWCATWAIRRGWPSRCAAGWCGGDGLANCARALKICYRGSHRCSTAHCFARRRWRRSAFPISDCSCAVTKSRCTDGWCARGCRSAPA